MAELDWVPEEKQQELENAWGENWKQNVDITMTNYLGNEEWENEEFEQESEERKIDILDAAIAASSENQNDVDSATAQQKNADIVDDLSWVSYEQYEKVAKVFQGEWSDNVISTMDLNYPDWKLWRDEDKTQILTRILDAYTVNDIEAPSPELNAKTQQISNEDLQSLLDSLDDWVKPMQATAIDKVFDGTWKEDVIKAMDSYSGVDWKNQPDDSKVELLDNVIKNFDENYSVSDELQQLLDELKWVKPEQATTIDKFLPGNWAEDVVNAMDQHSGVDNWKDQPDDLKSGLLDTILENFQNETEAEEGRTGDELQKLLDELDNWVTNEQAIKADVLSDKDWKEDVINVLDQHSGDDWKNQPDNRKSQILDQALEKVLAEIDQQTAQQQQQQATDEQTAQQQQEDKTDAPDAAPAPLPVSARARLAFDGRMVNGSFQDADHLVRTMAQFGGPDISGDIDTLVAQAQGRQEGTVKWFEWGGSEVGMSSYRDSTNDAPRIVLTLVGVFNAADMSQENDYRLHTLNKDGQSVKYAQCSSVVMLDPGDGDARYAILRYGHSLQGGGSNTEGTITRRNHRMRRDSLDVDAVPGSDQAAFKAAMKPITDKGIDFV